MGAGISAHQLDRAALTALVARLLAGDYTDSDELDRDSERLWSGLPHPGVLGLIFYPTGTSTTSRRRTRWWSARWPIAPSSCSGGRRGKGKGAQGWTWSRHENS